MGIDTRAFTRTAAAIHQARALLAHQVGKFTLERVEKSGKVSFKANGNIDFLGDKVNCTTEWCRGPESNWLRPPFQGGALPLSYPGTW